MLRGPYDLVPIWCGRYFRLNGIRAPVPMGEVGTFGIESITIASPTYISRDASFESTTFVNAPFISENSGACDIL